MLSTKIQIKAFRRDEKAGTTDADDELRRKLYKLIEMGNALADAEEDAQRKLQFGTRIQHGLYSR